MLKYKFNLKNIESEYKEVEYKELYLSPDGSYITGVTSPSYCLSNKQTIFIENAYDKDWQEYAIVAEDKIRCGFVKYNKKFNIETDENGNYYIRYNDGKAYRLINVIKDDEIIEYYVIVNNKKHIIQTGATYVLIETKYWCDDDVVTIDNVQYDVIENNTNIFIKQVEKEDGNVVEDDKAFEYKVHPYIILRNDDFDETESELNEYQRMLYIFDRSNEFRDKITHFKIQKKDNITFKVEEIVKVGDKHLNLYLQDYSYNFQNGDTINVKKINGEINFKLTIKENDNNLLSCIWHDINDDDINDLNSNINDYIFTISTPLFNEDNIKSWSNSEREYFESPIKLFTNTRTLSLPFSLSNDNSLNLHQEYIIKEEYYQKKVGEKINNIVDMEKDIYYPCYKITKNSGKYYFRICDEIQIDLHFRSRDLNTWNINSNEGDENIFKLPTNWNLFDYYRLNINDNGNNGEKKFYPLLNLNNDLNYYPPSDLLYFLNFKNEDVFYQKQKLSKSFIRLLFYDSKNPNSQNLLATSTIFINETDLYNKYIENTKRENNFITVEDRTFVKYKSGFTENILDNNNIVKNIGVGTEFLDNATLKSILFNENKRLSCSFKIKNRYESSSSSEGFFLYLFKDLFDKNNDKDITIYLKVEFNHAGEGKTINFMNMWINNDNEKRMINWGGDNIENHLEGYPLNELNEHLYIDIKLKYDEVNNKFCYYLPNWMVEHNKNKEIMKINLFEVKIKDESYEQNSESNTNGES